MNQEKDVMKKVMNTTELLQLVKSSLNDLILKLVNVGFNEETFFSEKLFLGNIGTYTNEKYQYLTSNSSTIREKMSAILNSIDKESNQNNHELLYNYIVDSITNNKWLIDRRSFLMNADKFDLNIEPYKWAPIDILYKSYRIKLDLMILYENNCDSNLRITEDQLLEPLSDFEKQFLKNQISENQVLNVNKSYVERLIEWITEHITGRKSYSYVRRYKCLDIDTLIEIERNPKELTVGGVSETTLLLVEMANLLGINWELVAVGCMIFLHPHSNSLLEIDDALNEMGLIDSLNKSIKEIAVEFSNVSSKDY